MIAFWSISCPFYKREYRHPCTPSAVLEPPVGRDAIVCPRNTFLHHINMPRSPRSLNLSIPCARYNCVRLPVSPGGTAGCRAGQGVFLLDPVHSVHSAHRRYLPSELSRTSSRTGTRRASCGSPAIAAISLSTIISPAARKSGSTEVSGGAE